MMEYIQQFFVSLWQLTLEMSPYLMLGFLFAGALHVWFPQHKVYSLLGKHNLRSVFNASLIGVPLPLCSCGVIPTGISFHKNGASKGAAISFMTSTPQTGVDSILVTWSMLGLPMAIVRPITAMITGIAGGWWVNKGEQKRIATKPLEQEQPSPKKRGVVAMLRYAFIDFMADIVKWLVIGLMLAAVIDVIVPDDFFGTYMSNSFYEYLFVILASIPLYVCATASVPIAAVLILKGISPGAALVFLMAGPATNAATITVIAQTLGRLTFIKYLATIVVGAVLSGLVVDHLLPAEWFAIADTGHIHEHTLLPQWLTWGSAIILTALIVYHLMKLFSGKFSKTSQNVRSAKAGEVLDNPQLKVDGMTCKHCKANVEKHLQQIENVESVVADEKSGVVTIQGGNIPIDEAAKQVAEIGYTFSGIVEK
ncbi:MAG: permease [Salinivirgaceae bacterium]